MRHENGTMDWSDDARLTAYALGELEGEERAALEAELEGDAAAQAALAELRATMAELEGELAAELASGAGEALPAEARARIASAAATSAGRGRRLRRVAMIVTGVAATGLVAFALALRDKTSAFRVASIEAPAENPALERIGYAKGGAYRGPGDSASPGRGKPATERLAGIGYVDLSDEERREGDSDSEVHVLFEALGYVGDDGEDPVLRYVPPSGELAELDQPRSAFSQESYAPIVENPFVRTNDDPMSTFSIDVDTASYANVRRFLNSGQLPPPDAVRIEEMINYFSYDYPQTDGTLPFGVATEVAQAPWAPEHRLVRIALRGDEIPIFEPKEKNLVFLIDVSGSMDDAAKLPLLKSAMGLLVDELSPRDRVGIVVYAGSSGVALEPTPCDRKEAIKAAIDALEPGGSTHGSAGIELAYALCEAVRSEGGVNRVILCTDGDFNVGVTGDDALVELIEEKRKRGVSLSVLGFGGGNLKDSKMEQLADHGNGNYAYVDSLDEAKKVLVREMGGTLETIAKDVKIQVQFDPDKVKSFRLIGYENRVLAHEDFADDTKDAGEIGAGHRVTALYEVEPTQAAIDAARLLDEFVPGRQGRYGEGADSLGTVRLRFKDPGGDESRLIERPLSNGPLSATGSADLRFAAGVAAFGMVLRGSEHVGDFTLRDVYDLAFSGAHDDPFGYRAELLRLVQRAIELTESGR